MVGIARDLAARLGLPFTLPEPPRPPPAAGPWGRWPAPWWTSPDLCPRLTVSVLRDVAVGPSPQWIAQRLMLAGMRPINNVVDASNYVMLELGQPTHPYDRSRLPGRGLIVRRARPGETIETLDGVSAWSACRGAASATPARTASSATPRATPVGIAGIMGGASSEIAGDHDEVLLEAAYFTPMVIARTSKRLGLRTEASARFERGVDPWGIEPSVRRFCQLLAESVAGLQVADGILDVRADVPEPFVVAVPIARVHSQIGVALGPARSPADRADRLQVLEQTARRRRAGGPGADQPSRHPAGALRDRRRHRGDRAHLRLLQRAAPGADLAAAGPAHGRCSAPAARSRTCCWAWARRRAGPTPSCRPRRTTTWTWWARPCWWPTRSMRRSRSCAGPCCPGLLGALAYNAGRRQPDVRLFEVGVVFSHPGAGLARVVERSGAGGTERAELPGERELLSAVFAGEDDERGLRRGGMARAGRTRSASRACAWSPPGDGTPPLPGLHPTRSAHLMARAGSLDEVTVGAVGEIDPAVAAGST